MRTLRLVTALFLAIAPLALITGVSPPAKAVPGDLDVTFDGDGAVITPIGSYAADEVVDAHAFADGKTLLLAQAYRPTGRMVFAKLLASGALDTSYGSGGITTVMPRVDSVHALAVDNAGRAVGLAADGPVCVVTRLTPNGGVDLGFGFGGTARIHADVGACGGLATRNDSAVAVASNGNIALLNSAGGLDTTFGVGGYATPTIPGAIPNDLVFDAANRVVASGSTETLSLNRHLAAFRFLATGAPDGTFGTAGVASMTIPGGTSSGVSVTLDGPEVVVGGTLESRPSFGVVARFKATGVADGTFNATGFKVSPVEGMNGSDVEVDSAGNYLLMGVQTLRGPGFTARSFAATRVKPAGGIDFGYDGDGSVTRTVGPGFASVGAGVILAGTQTATLYGSSQVAQASFSTFATGVRFTASGAPDGTFGTGGVLVRALSQTRQATVLGLAEEPSGALVAVGRVELEGGRAGFAARYLPDGSLDPTFGTNGVAMVPASFAAGLRSPSLLADGRLLVIVDDPGGPSQGRFIARLTRAGAVDLTFGVNGRAGVPGTIEPFYGDLAQLDDGGIVAAGIVGPGAHKLLVSRFRANGQPDVGFGAGGAFIASLSTGDTLVNGLEVLPNGAVAVGIIDRAFPAMGVAVISTTAVFDTSYGDGDGVISVTVPAGTFVGDIERLADGRIFVGGNVFVHPSSFQLARFTATGGSDPSFGTAGLLAVPTPPLFELESLDADQEQRLVWMGESSFGNRKLVGGRLFDTGVADPGFGGGSIITATVNQSFNVETAVVLRDGRVVAGGSSDSDDATDATLVRIEGGSTLLFAEGTVRPGFVEYLTLQNPSPLATTANLAFQAANDAGQTIPVPNFTRTLPANSRTTVNINEYIASVGITQPLNLSVKVTSPGRISAERPIYFFADPALGVSVGGGHAVVGAVSPDTQFLFAEGTVRPGFVEYITIQNATTRSGSVQFDFQASNDSGVLVAIPTLSRTISPQSRVTVNVNEYVVGRGFVNPVNLSIRVTSDVPILAERPAYFSGDPALGVSVDGGHVVVGAPDPWIEQNFAEGTVRPGFVEYLMLQNPGSVAGTATLVFQASRDDGSSVLVAPRVTPVAAASRVTINVNEYLASLGIPQPVNLSVRVTSDVPILAERPIYFSANPGAGALVDGGHDVIGAFGSARAFSFAEGTVRAGFVEYLTLQNPTPTGGSATLTFQAADDSGAAVGIAPKTVVIPPNSRVTVNVNDHVRLSTQAPVNLSVRVTSDVPLVAERPVYFSADPNLGVVVSDGTDVVGTPN